MKISIRNVGQAKVVAVEGDVDLGTSPDLRRTLFVTLPDLPNDARLALNLEAVRYIDSSGIATLIEALKDSQRLNKEFVLFGLSPAVQVVFRLTHVMRIFRVFDTEQEALGAP
jgi:anti-sigma B factor antagonist